MSNEELVTSIQAGATERMGELWEQVEKLVMWKAHRIMAVLDGRGGVEFDDLYQSGYPAMVAAVDSYRPEHGLFSTWFMLHLKTAFAEATGYRSAKQQRDPLHRAHSLDTPLTDETDSDDLMAIIADPAGMSGLQAAEDKVFRQQLHDALEAALSRIPENSRDVLRLRFWEDKTFEDIGELYGVSKERVRQMENTALRQLRQPRNACHLRPYYDFDFYCHTSLSAFNQSGMSVQERYLIIEEERKAREAEEQKRRDEEWRRQVEENQRWLAEQRAARRNDTFIGDMMQSLPPEGQEKLRAILKGHGYA